MPKNPASPRSTSASRWATPVAVVGILVGIAFLVFYVVAKNTDKDITVISSLGTWNLLVAAAGLVVAVLAFRASRQPAAPSSGPQARRIGNRWAAPAMVTSALIGLIWIVVYYVTNTGDSDVPLVTDLGNWNLVIGMGFIVAAFGFAMKWE